MQEFHDSKKTTGAARVDFKYAAEMELIIPSTSPLLTPDLVTSGKQDMPAPTEHKPKEEEKEKTKKRKNLSGTVDRLLAAYEEERKERAEFLRKQEELQRAKLEILSRLLPKDK